MKIKDLEVQIGVQVQQDHHHLQQIEVQDILQTLKNIIDSKVSYQHLSYSVRIYKHDTYDISLNK